jgi:hypothetical protein
MIMGFRKGQTYIRGMRLCLDIRNAIENTPESKRKHPEKQALRTVLERFAALGFNLCMFIVLCDICERNELRFLPVSAASYKAFKTFNRQIFSLTLLAFTLPKNSR